jgi:hypothetical protein
MVPKYSSVRTQTSLAAVGLLGGPAEALAGISAPSVTKPINNDLRELNIFFSPLTLRSEWSRLAIRATTWCSRREKKVQTVTWSYGEAR